MRDSSLSIMLQPTELLHMMVVEHEHGLQHLARRPGGIRLSVWVNAGPSERPQARVGCRLSVNDVNGYPNPIMKGVRGPAPGHENSSRRGSPTSAPLDEGFLDQVRRLPRTSFPANRCVEAPNCPQLLSAPRVTQAILRRSSSATGSAPLHRWVSRRAAGVCACRTRRRTDGIAVGRLGPPRRCLGRLRLLKRIPPCDRRSARLVRVIGARKIRVVELAPRPDP